MGQIEGTLERLIFNNADTGFLIGSCRGAGVVSGAFKVSGSLINPQLGVTYRFSGKWYDHKKYGNQFQFTTYETMAPLDIRGIYKYIVKVCKFVGPKKGQQIIDFFDVEALEIMKTDPLMLSDWVPGITLKRAEEIQKALLENEETERARVELETMLDVPQIRKTLVIEIIKEWGPHAADNLKQNPYLLTTFPRVGFLTADMVALKLGFDRNGIERKAAAALHLLQENERNGSIWMRRDGLIFEIKILIHVDEADTAIKHLLFEGDTSERGSVSSRKMVALRGTARDESDIAEMIEGFLI